LQSRFERSDQPTQFVLAPSQLAEFEQKLLGLKAETKKLFDQMRHIMQA